MHKTTITITITTTITTIHARTHAHTHAHRRPDGQAEGQAEGQAIGQAAHRTRQWTIGRLFVYVLLAKRGVDGKQRTRYNIDSPKGDEVLSQSHREVFTMSKYEIYDYDVCGNDEVGYGVNAVAKTGIIIYTDTSRSSLCKKLGLDNPYKIDVYYDYDDDVVCIEYYGKPYCELRWID